MDCIILQSLKRNEKSEDATSPAEDTILISFEFTYNNISLSSLFRERKKTIYSHLSIFIRWSDITLLVCWYRSRAEC